MIFNSDIDIDLGNRDQVLELIKYTPASIREGKEYRRHNTGIHVTDIPVDPINKISAINHVDSEQRGYVKLDLLNVSLYKMVKDPQHLTELMKEPDWSMLSDRTIVEKMIHIHKHYDTMRRMPEPVNSIPRMAMLLSIIRPGKRHLIGKTWSEVAKTIWDKDDGEGYVFRKSHSVAYAHLVVVNMNLYTENPMAFSEQE